MEKDLSNEGIWPEAGNRLGAVDGEEKERFRHTETWIISLGGTGVFV